MAVMHHPSAGATLTAPAVLLGLALGGFFDGILLHQILQWHHLLSNVEAASDLRVQILADGLFHGLMYLVAVTALWKLWRNRAALEAPFAGTRLASAALVGFGIWHIADAVLSHWLLGIHRVRSGAADPLAWDLAWFVAFGVLPLAAGLLLRRRFRDGGGGHGRGGAAGAWLAITAMVGGTIAAMPPEAGGQTIVVFAPGVSAGSAFNALAKVDARVQWVDRSGGVWAVQMDDASAAQLYRHGALWIGGATGAWGCAAWSVAAPAT